MFLGTAHDVSHACARKKQYHSEQGARSVAQRHINTNPEAPARLYVYACANCRQWHLTKEPNNSLAVTARELREGIAA